jgi:putative hemolysin
MEDPGGPGSLIPVIMFLLLIILSAGFFSFLKTALACCRKSRLRLLAEEGDKKYGAVLEAAEKIGPYLASVRIGIIFLEILTGCLGGLLLSKPLHVFFALRGIGNPWAAFLSVLIPALLMACAFFLLAEIIPRCIGRSIPEASAAAFFPFIKFLLCAASPLLMADRVLSAFIKKFFPSGASSTGMTEDELRIALLEGEKSGIVESEERTMVEGVFYLGDRPVGTFMTHRSEIRWLDINAGSEEARAAAEAGGDQRYFPVADGELDEVSGAVSVEDILIALLPARRALLPVGPGPEGGDSPARRALLPVGPGPEGGGSPAWPGLKALMKTPCFVPETMSAIKAFEAFKKAEADYLFVIDEYGGFSGILTVHNLIEEIVGQLSASETEGEEIQEQDDGTWLADGSVNIDDAVKALSLSAPGGDYHTLAGFILDLAGEIPKTGAHFDYHGYRFKIVALDGNRIDKVMISKLKD